MITEPVTLLNGSKILEKSREINHTDDIIHAVNEDVELGESVIVDAGETFNGIFHNIDDVSNQVMNVSVFQSVFVCNKKIDGKS